MNDIKEKVLKELNELFDATEIALNEWSGTGNLQFPHLLSTLAGRLNWDEKQLRRFDPFVREYVRGHTNWHVTRGAHGGIMRTTDKQKKETDRLNKESIKKQLKEELEAKLASVSSENKE